MWVWFDQDVWMLHLQFKYDFIFQLQADNSGCWRSSSWRGQLPYMSNPCCFGSYNKWEFFQLREEKKKVYIDWHLTTHQFVQTRLTPHLFSASQEANSWNDGLLWIKTTERSKSVKSSCWKGADRMSSGETGMDFSGAKMIVKNYPENLQFNLSPLVRWLTPLL